MTEISPREMVAGAVEHAMGPLRDGDHSPEIVEQALWEIAVCGGNVARSHRNLVEMDPDGQWPSQETMRRWIRGKYRNRYYLIMHEKLTLIDQQMTGQHLERAQGFDRLEKDLTTQIAQGVHDLNAVDASNVLRNVSQSKRIAVEGALAIRNRERALDDARGLGEIARALVNLGVASVDSTAEEITEGEALPPST